MSVSVAVVNASGAIVGATLASTGATTVGTDLTVAGTLTAGTVSAGTVNGVGVSSASVSTTDATQTTIQTIATTSNTVYLARTRVHGRDTTTGTDAASFYLVQGFKNNAGTVALVGSPVIMSWADAALSTASVAYAASGSSRSGCDVRWALQHHRLERCLGGFRLNERRHCGANAAAAE